MVSRCRQQSRFSSLASLPLSMCWLHIKAGSPYGHRMTPRIQHREGAVRLRSEQNPEPHTDWSVIVARVLLHPGISLGSFPSHLSLCAHLKRKI